jgi:hypothetical protein
MSVWDLHTYLLHIYIYIKRCTYKTYQVITYRIKTHQFIELIRSKHIAIKTYRSKHILIHQWLVITHVARPHQN